MAPPGGSLLNAGKVSLPILLFAVFKEPGIFLSFSEWSEKIKRHKPILETEHRSMSSPSPSPGGTNGVTSPQGSREMNSSKEQANALAWAQPLSGSGHPHTILSPPFC